MILIVCTPCNLALRVMGNPIELDQLVGRESPFWPSSFPCPRCEKKAHGLLEVEADPNALRVMELLDLTPQEAFIAFSGMGLPNERSCGRAQIEELFKTPVRRVVGQATQTDRFILEHIEFWDGTKLYLGAAPGGAVVYRIAAPPSYAKEALHG